MQKLTIDDDYINKIKIERQVKVRDILIDVPLRYKCNAINAIFPISSVNSETEDLVYYYTLSFLV